MEHPHNSDGELSLDEYVEEEEDEIQSLGDDSIEELEEEVKLHEANLATLNGKLNSIDAAISKERRILKQRKTNLQSLLERKTHLSQSHESNTKLVREIESNLRKCLATMKKKMNEIRKERVHEETHQDHPDYVVEPLKISALNPSTQTDMETILPIIHSKPIHAANSTSHPMTNSSSSSSQMVANLKEKPPSLTQIHHQTFLSIKAKNFHHKIANIKREILFKHMKSNPGISIRPEMEQRCYVGTLLPCISSPTVLEHIVMTQYEEVLELLKAENKKSHEYKNIKRDIHLLGSCIDPYYLMYHWHSPGKRMTLPWENTSSLPSSDITILTKKQNKETHTLSIFHNSHEEKQNANPQTTTSLDKQHEFPDSSTLDPNSILCPFELSGTCLDLNCTYQHIDNETRNQMFIKNMFHIHDTNLPFEMNITQLLNNHNTIDDKPTPKIQPKQSKQSKEGNASNIQINTNQILPQKRKHMNRNITINSSIVQEEQDDTKHWKGEELDFVPISSHCSSPYSSENSVDDTNETPPIKKLSPIDLFWWWDISKQWYLSKTKYEKNRTNLDRDKLFIPCDLYDLFAVFGFHVSSNENYESTFVHFYHTFHKHLDLEIHFIPFTAALVDCIRLSIFSGRSELAFAFIDLGKDILKNEKEYVTPTNTSEKMTSDSVSRKYQREAIFIITHNAIVSANTIVERSLCATAFSDFHHQRAFMLLSEALLTLHSSMEKINKDHTLKDVKSINEDKTQELLFQTLIDTWGKKIDACVATIVQSEKDVLGTRYDAMCQKIDFVNEDVTSLEFEFMDWVRNEIQSLPESKVIQDSTNSLISSFGTNMVHHPDSIPEIDRFDYLLKCSLLGSQLAQMLIRFSSHIHNIKKYNSLLHLKQIQMTVDLIWKEIQYFTFSNDVYTEDFRPLCGTLLIVPVIFAFVHISLQFSQLEGNFFGLDYNSYNFWLKLDEKLDRLITRLHSKKYLLKNELLLAPMISISVSISIFLRMPNKAHTRIERVFSSCPIADKDTQVPSNIMLFSELLWSQLLSIRFTFPISLNNPNDHKKNIHLISSLIILLTRYNVFVAHLNLPGDSDLVRKAYYDTDASIMSTAQSTCSILCRGTKSGSTIRELSLNRLPFHLSTVYPMSILSLSNGLIKLSISKCCITFLPKTFGKQFSQLEEFDASQNKLSFLPESICMIKSLRICSVSSNDLSSLPNGIGKLSNLCRFMASFNKIKSLPISITECANLQELDLRHNAIETIPRDLPLKLSNLESLSIDDNPMSSNLF